MIPVLPELSLRMGVGGVVPHAAFDLRGLLLTQAKGGKGQERWGGQDTLWAYSPEPSKNPGWVCHHG